MDSMNRRTMMGGAAALAAIPAGIGTHSVFGDLWRTDATANFVAQTKAVIGTMKSMGMDVWGAYADTKPVNLVQDPFYASHGVPLPDVMHTVFSDVANPEILDESALRMLRDGDIELAGKWSIDSHHPGTEGIDGELMIGFTADHGIERGSIQFRGRSAWLAPDNDPNTTIGLVAAVIHDRFIGETPWVRNAANAA